MLATASAWNRLIDRIDEQQFPDFKDEMSKRLIAARHACAFARDVRNKLLAHSDLATSLRDRAAGGVSDHHNEH